MDRILISSASLDSHTVGPVKEILEQKGYDVLVYLTDLVLKHEMNFTTIVDDQGAVKIELDKIDISPESISAAWYRKLTNYTYENNDKLKSLYLRQELGFMHDHIWGHYPEEIWLNSPDRIKSSDRKPNQLSAAAKSGFSLPKTVVSNSWDDIRDEIGDVDIVAKTIRGLVSENDQVKAMPTTRLDRQSLARLESSGVMPYPAIYQQYIPKNKEWRVTVVGDNVFAVAIYTDESAKDDWRVKQSTNSVEFRSEDFPEDISAKCINYLAMMDLRFGAFDFIETPYGETIFLECNPNGQYIWLEEELELPISNSIAAELIKIARNQ